jgi:hypothetical protein
LEPRRPRFGGAALRALASDWRVSGILNARSGSWLTVVSGRDDVFNGMANQRVNQVSGDVYSAKTVTNYLNPAAFAQPAPGQFGTHVRNSIKGPGFWKVDLALSGLVSLAATSESRCRNLRPHHDDDRRSAHHAVRHHVRLLRKHLGGLT